MQHPESIAQKIKLVHQRINENPAGNYYISQLAKQVGLTTAVFNNAFKQQYQQTLQQCITQAKMRLAMQQLLQNKAIKIIAAELGYKQVINFHKTFKRHTGITPKQYYQQHKLPPGCGTTR